MKFLMCVIFQTQSGNMKRVEEAEKKSRQRASESGEYFRNVWSKKVQNIHDPERPSLVAFWFEKSRISANYTWHVSISADSKINDNTWHHWLTAPFCKNPKIDANFYLLPHFFFL